MGPRHCSQIGSSMGFLSDVFSLQSGRYPVISRSTLGTWTLVQGVIYMMHGVAIEFYPKFWCLVMLSDEKSAMEGWFRAFGFAVFYIGLFYLFAGLADSKQFAAVSVFTRCVFVPILFSSLGVAGYIPIGIAVYFTLADPFFAVITFIVYQRDVAASGNPASF